MAQEADLLCVLDTNSKDDSLQMLKNGHRNIRLDVATIQPWRFDSARNLCLQMVPEDYDLCVWMDFDEYFQPGWRKTIESFYDPKFTRYINKFKNMATQFEYFHFKIHQRKDCYWRFPIHEQLVFSQPEVTKVIDELVCEHYQDLTKDRTFYITMLERALREKELPFLHYTPLLIREYFVNKKYERCMETFETFLQGPNFQFLPPHRKANCYRYYITSLEELGLPRTRELIEEYASLYPLRDHYYVAAWAMRKIKEFRRALDFLEMGDVQSNIDMSAEFIHPSARTEKYERLRAALRLELGDE